MKINVERKSDDGRSSVPYRRNESHSVVILSPVVGGEERGEGASPTAKARALRRATTPSEKALWKLLRDRKLDGMKFRRQHPIGPYFADFFCAEKMLAIELDGGGHGVPINEYRDFKRDQVIESFGIRVIRIWNSEFRENPDGVIYRIRQAVAMPPLTPALSPRRRRERVSSSSP